ncbi:MAG: hypothetical protein WCE58_09445, partial [Gallionella sp.]
LWLLPLLLLPLHQPRQKLQSQQRRRLTKKRSTQRKQRKKRKLNPQQPHQWPSNTGASLKKAGETLPFLFLM